MNDLVKKLRDWTVTGHSPTMLEIEAAARIEQLERELAEWKEGSQTQGDIIMMTSDDLAAEKALADRAVKSLEYYKGVKARVEFNQAMEAEAVMKDHRKARGL